MSRLQNSKRGWKGPSAERKKIYLYIIYISYNKYINKTNKHKAKNMPKLSRLQDHQLVLVCPVPNSMMSQRKLGTPTRTDGHEKCHLSAFKPLVVSTYNARTQYQHRKTQQHCTDAGGAIAGIRKNIVQLQPIPQKSNGLMIRTSY